MKRILGFGVIAIALLGATGAAADDAIGKISSLTGQATAQRPGEEPRALACGDAVYADDTLRTAADSRLGVQLDDVAAHLAADTRVVLGRTGQAMPAARLEAGKLRMIDPRDEGAAAELAALDATAAIAGNDAEAYIFPEKVGPYAMLCEWDEPLAVSRAPGESAAADPGECVISKPKEPLYTANAHDERLPVDVAEACDLGPQLAQLSSPLHHLTPKDVAAPPPPVGTGVAGLGGQNPSQGPGFDRRTCDFAAGACQQPLPIVVAEPPPVDDLPAPGVP